MNLKKLTSCSQPTQWWTKNGKHALCRGEPACPPAGVEQNNDVVVVTPQTAPIGNDIDTLKNKEHEFEPLPYYQNGDSYCARDFCLFAILLGSKK